MAQDKKIYSFCTRCKGIGEIHTVVRYENEVPVYEEIECRVCSGTGKVLWGIMEKDD